MHTANEQQPQYSVLATDAPPWDWARLASICLIAGVTEVAAGVGMYVAGVYFAPWSMAVSLVVLLLCIVFGIRWYQGDSAFKRMSYARAVLIGVAISVSTGAVYAVYNIVSIGFFYTGFLEQVARLRAERMVPGNAAAAPLTASAIAIANLTRLSVMGAVLALFAALARRK